MANLYDNIGNRLYSGENVKCPKCNKGYIIPENDSIHPENAHYFKCSNVSCDYDMHFDPAITID